MNQMNILIWGKKLKTVGYIEKDSNDEIIENLCEEIKEDHKFSIQLLEQYALVQKRIKKKMKQLQENLIWIMFFLLLFIFFFHLYVIYMMYIRVIYIMFMFVPVFFFTIFFIVYLEMVYTCFLRCKMCSQLLCIRYFLSTTINIRNTENISIRN